MKRTHLVGLVLGLAIMVATAEVASAQAEDDESAEGAAPAKKDDGPSLLVIFGSYALVLGGAVVIGIGVAKTFSTSMSYPQARLMMVNLLRSNPNQAEQVARRMEGTFCEAIAATIKVGGMAQSQDLATIASATAPTYDALGQGVVQKWGTLITKSKLGLMAAIAGAAIGLSGKLILPVIIAVLVVAGFVRLFLYKQEIESTVMRARRDVLPEVDRAIASGRYVVQPGK